MNWKVRTLHNAYDKYITKLFEWKISLFAWITWSTSDNLNRDFESMGSTRKALLQYYHKAINKHICRLTFEFLWFFRSTMCLYTNKIHSESFTILYDKLSPSDKISSLFPLINSMGRNNLCQLSNSEAIDSTDLYNAKEIKRLQSIESKSIQTITQMQAQDSKSVQTDPCNDANASNSALQPTINVFYHSNHLTSSPPSMNTLINSASPNQHNNIYNLTFHSPNPPPHHHSTVNTSSQTQTTHNAIHNADNTSTKSTNTLLNNLDNSTSNPSPAERVSRWQQCDDPVSNPIEPFQPLHPQAGPYHHQLHVFCISN